jgi:hypothetical protein
MISSSIKLLAIVGLLGVGQSYGQDRDYLTVTSVKVTKIKQDIINQRISEVVFEKDLGQAKLLDLPGMPDKSGHVSTEDVGKVISVTRELVALGEDIYRLVQKGKPVNTTTYAPISVLPKVNGQAVDIFETEGWRLPSKATYEITYKNVYGMEVVKYRYSIIFTYGGTYQGKGAYLTAAQIVPDSVETLWGYTFTASMSLGGIQNHGTKENPIAGAVLAMQYSVETVVKASLTTDMYHITGKGGFNSL